MGLTDVYLKLKERKLAAGFVDEHGSQIVKKQTMRLVAVGLEIDIEDLDRFAREYTEGVARSRGVAVNYKGLLVMPPDAMLAVIVDMVLLGAMAHEQARRELDA